MNHRVSIVVSSTSTTESGLGSPEVCSKACCLSKSFFSKECVHCTFFFSYHGDPVADQIVRGPSGWCRSDLISTPDFGYSRVFYKSFLWANLRFGGCFERPSLQASFWCKKLRSWQKIGKVTKRRRSLKPTSANGGTNRANGGTNAIFCTSGDFPFFLAWCQICFEFESATVKREKKRKTKGKKDCGQRQREKISLIFRRASSLEKEIDDHCLHLCEEFLMQSTSLFNCSQIQGRRKVFCIGTAK